VSFLRGKELMDRDFLVRIISGGVFAVCSLWCIFADEIIWLVVFTIPEILYEWWKIAKYKNKVLFWWGLVYMLLPLLFLIWIAYTRSDRIPIITWVLLSACFTDIFAYIGGRIIGGPKLAPSISPKKTWSGAIVGFVFSVILSSFYFWYFSSEPLLTIVLLTMLLSVSSIIGDLIESKVKRYLGIKDTGVILPGHGGIIDRLDGIFLATYTFALISLWFFE
jgi:phosphatidate cytidylyltransferase